MKTFLIALVAVIGLTLVDVGTAEAFGGRRRAQVTYAPAPTATIVQGQAETGYRSYSYQPGSQSNSYQPTYRSFNQSAGSGFHGAGWKIRGGN
jgi:hypothetical protein